MIASTPPTAIGRHRNRETDRSLEQIAERTANERDGRVLTRLETAARNRGGAAAGGGYRDGEGMPATGSIAITPAESVSDRVRFGTETTGSRSRCRKQ
ncbi:hypothetical protein C478_14442 [Natrinema thermotolerans DSM 11552]|nr:hypothetical protein C478_14442 [Natrinema thermotolerans DSM 11552]QCC59980.1 hypothetical protein DVR14_15630 [Natrinema thermotolerans]